ncbi:MAG: hypothetical protein OSJ60_19345 [Lachnospiraceae bacterium]|uniref:hypothetical protein n=1 Tax=uncultured Phocaeicola sp. TaxID=990718 RepID=UPI0004AF54A6|nr:hypothetical protein [uncultured Phocaeicola sp.]MCX4353751.1 hypothetical protein [Lachnospiraceae bacterium]
MGYAPRRCSATTSGRETEESVTDEQVSTILKVLFHWGDTQRLVVQVLTENRKEDAE